MVRYHLQTHGPVCPGWDTTLPHESHDLTVDHDAGVLCRACNTRKRNMGGG